jgi:hypothetical protein
VGKPEEKRPLERPRHMFVDSIKMDLCMDWIDLAQERGHWWPLVDMVMNLWIP